MLAHRQKQHAGLSAASAGSSEICIPSDGLYCGVLLLKSMLRTFVNLQTGGRRSKPPKGVLSSYCAGFDADERMLHWDFVQHAAIVASAIVLT